MVVTRLVDLGYARPDSETERIIVDVEGTTRVPMGTPLLAGRTPLLETEERAALTVPPRRGGTNPGTLDTEFVQMPETDVGAKRPGMAISPSRNCSRFLCQPTGRMVGQKDANVVPVKPVDVVVTADASKLGRMYREPAFVGFIYTLFKL